jgi:hypothetical protein
MRTLDNGVVVFESLADAAPRANTQESYAIVYPVPDKPFWHRAENEKGVLAECPDQQDALAIASYFARRQLMDAAPGLLESLKIMTALCRLKYGNLDADVYAQIEKAEALIQNAEGGK